MAPKCTNGRVARTLLVSREQISFLLRGLSMHGNAFLSDVHLWLGRPQMVVLFDIPLAGSVLLFSGC